MASFDWLVESSMWLDFRFFSGGSFLVSTTVGRGWKGSWTMDISEEEFSEEIKQ